MIPDSLKQLLSHVDGHQRATWEGRDVALFNMAWGEM
ncbi:MAG TPA: D-hexose-6-phosphate mutarotase, partial [Halomonas sp.]|nr:D-hexose-6-phosphate mutarotase [Halomonas sp.]